MKIKKFDFTFIAVLISVPIALAKADNQLSLTKDNLVCGEAEVVVETVCLELPEIQTQCKKQTLRLINSREGISKELPHDGKLIHKPSLIKEDTVLDAFVTSWACLKSESRTLYILLWYTCSWGEEKQDCIGYNREWERIFGVDGRHLTAGFPKQGKRYKKLYQQLGLFKLMEKGLDLQSIKH